MYLHCGLFFMVKNVGKIYQSHGVCFGYGKPFFWPPEKCWAGWAIRQPINQVFHGCENLREGIYLQRWEIRSPRKAIALLHQSNNNMKNRNPPKGWTSFYINWLYYQHLPFGLPSLNPKTLVSLFPPCTGTIQGTQNVWPLELEWQQRQVKAVLKNSSKSPYFFRMWKKTTKDTHPGSTLQVISESIKLILFDIIPLRISFWSTACGFYQF